MNALIVPPSKNLIEEIISHLVVEQSDYSSNMVVFPGKRPSHFLRKALAEKIRTGFIPPVVCSMDEFVDKMYEDSGSGRKLETIDAAAILYNIHRKAQSPLGGRGFMSPDAFFPIGIKIYRDIEELYIEGISAQAVKAVQPYSDETIPEQTRKRLQSLSCFYEEFYRYIEKEGLSTRSTRYRAVSEKIDEVLPGKSSKIIFAGFFALTNPEKTLFRKILSYENALFIFQSGPGIKERLNDLSINIEENFPECPMPDVEFYSSPDVHGQVYALGMLLKDRLEEKKHLDEKSAIVLPSSDALFPLLRQGLPLKDNDSYNISLGYPLNRTPIFGFLNNLIELITSMDSGRIYLPHYLKFVLHPYIKNIYFKDSSEITRIIFHAMEEYHTKNRTRTFAALDDIENDSGLLNHIMEKIPPDIYGITKNQVKAHIKAIHSNTISEFITFENVRDFALKCTGLIVYIYNNSTARLHPLFYPFSESFIKALDVIGGSLMKDMAFTDTSGYFTFFRKYIMTRYSPFEGSPLRGLQILGLLETRSLKFEEVFVLDVNEDTIPDTRKDDTLLPFKAREILGLPTYMDRDRLVEYYFGTLLNGARRVHLFFIESDTKERSRFVERLIWERQKTDNMQDTAKYIRTVQYRVNLKNTEPEPITKSTDVTEFLKNFTYSATALDKYLKCPLRFYYSYVLDLGKKEEITGEIERTDIGSFIHSVLSAFFRKRTGFRLKAKDIDIEEMNQIVDKSFEADFGRDPAGSVYLLYRQIKNHLRHLLERYYMPLVSNQAVTIVETEKPLSISSGHFKLKGRLDSIEKRDGRTVVVDYKTGSNRNNLKIRFDKLDINNRDTWGKAAGSLQLPFYIMLYSGETRISPENIDGMFLLLGSSSISRDIELPLYNGTGTEEAYGVLRSVIFGLLNEIVDPSLPFAPASDLKSSCPDCSFKFICGTQWIVK